MMTMWMMVMMMMGVCGWKFDNGNHRETIHPNNNRLMRVHSIAFVQNAHMNCCCCCSTHSLSSCYWVLAQTTGTTTTTTSTPPPSPPPSSTALKIHLILCIIFEGFRAHGVRLAELLHCCKAIMQPASRIANASGLCLSGQPQTDRHTYQNVHRPLFGCTTVHITHCTLHQ